MGAEQPFLYDHPSKYSFTGPSETGFNPKAASQASFSPPRSRPKQDRPLINAKEFNRHPDSYFVVPYGNLSAKAMSPRTKAKVKWMRLIQMFLRICELLGAAGMLVCVICIKGTDATTGWIIRVPPAVAILHTVYAIYHLARSSKGRTPASSASYMLFAAIIDVGLIPFLVFTALIARTEYAEPSNTIGRWQTLFVSDVANNKIILSTFLISVVNGGMHLTSLIISIYLGVIFRKISRLPPDMNPLEDNLTSRHKRNKSSLMENRMSQATTTTSATNSGFRVEEPLISPVRNVPFMHTRNDSHSNVNNVPSLNFSPRVSKSNISSPFYDPVTSHRASRTTFAEHSENPQPFHRSSRTDISTPFYNQPPSHGASRTTFEERPPSQAPSHRTSRTYFPNLSQVQATLEPESKNLNRSPTKSSSIYTTTTTTTTRPGSTAPSLPDSNWITHPSPSPSPSPSPPRELKLLLHKKVYQPLSQTSPFEYTQDENASFNPLNMNPPTPPIQQQNFLPQTTENRALTLGTGNVGQGNRSWGPGTVGIGKAKAWGGMDAGARSSGMGGGGRVISRSGVEVRDGGIWPSGGVRAREVSGKVAEEGRGVRWGAVR